jgi:hypothetical protein
MEFECRALRPDDNEADKRPLRTDARYRFAIDMSRSQ